MTDLEAEEDIVSQDEEMENGGMALDEDDLSEGASSAGDTGDEISIGEDEELETEDEQNEMPKRQRLA